MASNTKPRFEIIQGGSARDNNALIDTGTVGQDKPSLKKPRASSGGGRGGGSQAVSIAKLEQSIGWAWKALTSIFTLGLVGMVSLYFLLANRIDDRYDKTGSKLDRVVEQISDLRVDVAHEGARLSSATKEGAPKNNGKRS